jgi:hypothetical protein
MFGWFKKRKEDDSAESFTSMVSQMVAPQLFPSYAQPKDAFSAFMTDHAAAGYLFGMHDALLQQFQLVDRDNPDSGLELMKSSYRNLFGEQAGTALVSMSMYLDEKADFQTARMSAGADVEEFFQKKTPLMGLNRIVILGMRE